MKNKGNRTIIIMAAILLVCVIVFWGSIFGGICLLGLGAIPITLLRQWYRSQGDPLDYSDSPEDE